MIIKTDVIDIINNRRDVASRNERAKAYSKKCAKKRVCATVWKILSVLAIGLVIILLFCCCGKPDTPSDIEVDNAGWMTNSTQEDVSVEQNNSPVVFEPTEQVSSEEHKDTSTESPEDTESDVLESTYYCEWGDVYFTQQEYELLLTTVFCESGGESSKEQHAVACAILNQIVSGKFGSTVHKVIYKKNNFAVTKWPDFENTGWTDKVEKSVLQALVDNPYPRNMYYFRTSHFHTFEGAIDYKKIGVFYFSMSN